MSEIESLCARLEEQVAARDMRRAEPLATEIWRIARDPGFGDGGDVSPKVAVTFIKVAEIFRLRLDDAHGATRVLRRAFDGADATPYDAERPSYREEIAWRLGVEFENANCHRSAAHWFKKALALARSRPVPDHVMRNLKGVAWNLEAVESGGGDESPAPYYDELLRMAWPEADPGRLLSRLWMTNCAAMYALSHGDQALGRELLEAQVALVAQGEDELGDWFGVSIHGLGLHHLANGRPDEAIALADSMSGHEARFGFVETRWFVNRMHALRARAFVLQGQFDAALDEIRQVFDIDAGEDFRFGPQLGLEEAELWLEVARIRVHRQEFRRAAIAYQFIAWSYGERTADDQRANTARKRMVWTERQAAVVHELASVWCDLEGRPERAEVQPFVANALLQLKANLYLATAGNRLVAFRDDPAFVRRMFSANRRFAAAVRQGLARPDDQDAALRLEDLLFLREQVEAKMTAGSFEMMPSLAEVFHFDFTALEKVAAGRSNLIDYSLVDHRPPQQGRAGRPQGRRYIGVLLTPGPTRVAPGIFRVVDLGEAADIDGQAQAFTRACARRPADKLAADRHLGGHDAWAPGGDALLAGRRLYERIVAPFGELEGQLVVSPDGLLAAVPFHALRPDDEHFLIEQRDVGVCHSLLIQQAIDVRQRIPGMRIDEAVARVVPDVLLLGDPDYRDTGFEPLAGTRDEVVGIAGTFQAVPWQPPEAVRLHLGPEADVSHATGTLHPHVLHIAAHGGYAQADAGLPDADLNDQRLNWRRQEDSGARALSPFDAALLGAFLTLSLDANAEHGEFEAVDRRRLTALELSSLNLIASRVVVLSACETGLGVSVHGAGVLGFQYALTAAFATNALLSLWRVPDRETADLMIDLYRRVLAEPHGGFETPIVRTAHAEALRAACRVDGRAVHPYYWAAFTYLGAR